ncbi:hypothetical protein [Marimonas arenosa]|uniref:Uncharacterized protein n=1 Tax=Marimonas arenosa TaxID=1795305 RepID=A0AAE3WI93_9RHOB|nr:hypothetical protein [Marimonas arenosa]MDQ2092140.1 hypothetical protein [Marimonas arenosa]
MKNIIPAALHLGMLAATALTAPASAQTTLLTGNHSIDGRLCVGRECTAAENFTVNQTTLKLKDFDGPRILFDNPGTFTGGAPKPDWILGNEQIGSSFTLREVATNNAIVNVWSGAPSSALTIRDTGAIGLGTLVAERHLHLRTGDAPAIRFEQDSALGFPPYIWDMIAHETAFHIRDETNSSIPVWIETGGISNALVIEDSGEIGLGIYEPAASLHIHRDNGTAQLKVEETSAAVSPRTLMNLQNNGRPEIVMGNTGTGGEWSFGAGTNFILKQGAVGSASSAKTKLFEIQPSGNAILAGTLTTGGTTCGGGCDRVFTEAAIIPAPDYAARMWGDGHLPHVGPTPEGAPINVSEKLGGMLNALEHAHVFIDQQAAEIEALKIAYATEIAALRQDLAALTARIAAAD